MTRPPYLPFRGGPPTIAPNLVPIEEGRWLRPDTEAHDWLEEKRELMVRCRDDVLAILPGSGAACCEASRMIFEHIGRKNAFLLKTELEDAASYVSDDLCIMQQNDAGAWCLTAASLCAPTYWKLKDFVGCPLGGLHADVPSGDPDLASRIGRIFSAMRPGQIMERCNWTVQAGGERFTPSSLPIKEAAKQIEVDDALNQVYLRVERQTVRKLPNTGAVLFSIRICIDPLAAVFARPGVKEDFKNAWTNAPAEISAYKGWSAYQHLIEAVLT